MQLMTALAAQSVFWLTEVINANTEWTWDDDEDLNFGYLCPDAVPCISTYIDGVLQTLFLIDDARELDRGVVPGPLLKHVEEVASYEWTLEDDWDPRKYLAWAHKRVLAAAAMPSTDEEGSERDVRAKGLFCLVGDFLVLMDAHLQRTSARGGLEHEDLLEIFECIGCIQKGVEALVDAEDMPVGVPASFYVRCVQSLTGKWFRSCSEEAVAVVRTAYEQCFATLQRPATHPVA